MAAAAFTPRLKLEFVVEGQLRAEVPYNENLARLALFLGANYLAVGATAQPGSPSNGAIYILAASGLSGADWPGHESEIAYYLDGWQFIPPQDGFRGKLDTNDRLILYRSGAWYSWDGSAWQAE